MWQDSMKKPREKRTVPENFSWGVGLNSLPNKLGVTGASIGQGKPVA